MAMGIMAWLGLNTSGFARGLNDAKGQAKAAGGSIAGSLGKAVAGRIGAFASVAAVTAGIERAVRASVEYADEMGDIASRLGITVEATQAWDLALQKSGSSIQQAIPFFERLAVAKKKAMEGDQNMIAAFSKFGMSIDMLKSKSTEEIGIHLAKAFQVGNPQDLIADFRELGGKSAGSMVAAFRAGLADLVKANKESLAIMSQDTVDSLKDSQDRVKTVGAYIRALLGKAVAPVFKMNLDLGELGVWTAKAAAAAAKGLATGGLKGAKEAAAAVKREMVAAHTKKPADDSLAGLDLDGEVQDTKEIDDLKDKLVNKLNANALAEMSNEEKIIALKRMRLEIEKEIAAAGSDKDRLERQIELADTDKKIGDLERSEVKKEDKENKAEAKKLEKEDVADMKATKHSVNSLQQIGGFLGNFAAAGSTYGPEQVAQTTRQKMAAHLESIDKLMKKSGGAQGSSSDVDY